MQQCLGSQVNDILLIYLDDVIIFSPAYLSWWCHRFLTQLLEPSPSTGAGVWEAVEARPQVAAPQMQTLPCQSELSWSCGQQGGGRHRPREDCSCTTMETPCNSLGSQVLFGVCWLLHGFSHSAVPLNVFLAGTATQKDRPMQQTLDCQAAFDKLEWASILAYDDFPSSSSSTQMHV